MRVEGDFCVLFEYLWLSLWLFLMHTSRFAVA